MTFLKALAFCLLICSSSVRGQDKNLINSIQTSDSIYLVSMEIVPGIIKDSSGNFQRASMIVGGKLSTRFIKQVTKLPDTLLNDLLRIFSRPFGDKQIVTCNSFYPDHGILIFNKGELLTYQLSITCNSYTKEGGGSIEYLDSVGKNKLLNIFKVLGFQVE